MRKYVMTCLACYVDIKNRRDRRGSNTLTDDNTIWGHTMKTTTMKKIHFLIFFLFAMTCMACSSSDTGQEDPPASENAGQTAYYHFIIQGEAVKEPSAPLLDDDVYGTTAKIDLKFELLFTVTNDGTTPTLKYYKSELYQTYENNEEEWFLDGLDMRSTLPAEVLENVFPLLATSTYNPGTNEIILTTNSLAISEALWPTTSVTYIFPGGMSDTAEIPEIKFITENLASMMPFLIEDVPADSATTAPDFFAETTVWQSLQYFKVSYTAGLSYMGQYTVSAEELSGWVEAAAAAVE